MSFRKKSTMLHPKFFLFTCVSFILISRVFSCIEEPLSDSHEPSIDASEVKMEHLEPERRKEIMDKYLGTLPSVDDWVDPYDMIGSSMEQLREKMEIKDPHPDRDPEPIAIEATSSETSYNAANLNKPAPDRTTGSKNPATDSKKPETNPKKPETNPRKPETDPKKPETDPKKSATDSSNTATDSCKASAIPKEQKVFCALDSIYVTRWIKRLLHRIEKESDNESSTISFSLDSTTFNSLKEMSTAKLFEISTFDDIISNLLSQATITPKEPFTWYRTFVFYSDMFRVIMYSLSMCSVVYVIHRCFITHPVKTLLCSVVVISVVWHWMHLYKQQVAMHHAELASMQIPTQCRKHDLGLMEHINEYFKSFFATNDCSKYYEALLVDPFWKVSITMAISEAFAAFIFQPLFAASRAINACIKQLFDGLPIHLTVALIVFIFMLALILRNYSVRFFWFTGIEPSRGIAGSRVEEVPQPTLMQTVSQAVRNAISDNQTPPVESIQSEVSTGLSERPNTLTSKTVKHNKNRPNSEGTPGIASNMKNPEDNIAIQSSCFDVNKSIQSEHDKPEVMKKESENIEKSPKKESFSAMPPETIPKRLAIEETSKVDTLSSMKAKSDVPSFDKSYSKENYENFQKQEVSNLKDTLSDSFEVLPIPSDDDDSNVRSFCSAGPNCDTSMDMLQELHKGCKYCQ